MPRVGLTAATNAEDEVLAAMAMLDAEANGDLALLCKYLGNVLRAPQEDRYRCIRIGNARFTSAVWAARGARVLLGALGFKEDADGFLRAAPPSSAQIALINSSLAHLSQLEAIRRHRDALIYGKAAAPAPTPTPTPNLPGTLAGQQHDPLASPPPWANIRVGSGGGGDGGGSGAEDNSWRSGGHWVSQDEHFDRAQRNSRMPPPPPPGRAPSSNGNGKWGR